MPKTEWRRRGKLVTLAILVLLVVSTILSILSFYPVATSAQQDVVILDNSFRLMPQETYHQGLGSFHGNENLTVLVDKSGGHFVNFSMLTYGGLRYSNLSTLDINYTFPAGADYYEAIFQTNATKPSDIHLQVLVYKPVVQFPLASVGIPAKALFIFSWLTMLALLLKPYIQNRLKPDFEQPSVPHLDKRTLEGIKIAIAVSMLLWFVLLAVNTYPFATFENWYTDGARHPYTSTLFGKVGFSVFDTPLGQLSSLDSANYMFVTWPEMPHLYPVGSILFYLPFGALLEGGVAQAVVFKLGIALLIVVSHVCLYLFVKLFWKHDWSFVLKLGKQDSTYVLKVLALYLFYIVLVIYSANGQFDTIAFLFSIVGMALFMDKRYSHFLLFAVLSATFKYQAGIFLLPLIMLSVIRLLQQNKPSTLIRNKVLLAVGLLGAVDLFTAYLSAPFLMSARLEFIMNGVNAFSPHAQIPWSLQAFAVLLTLGMTIGCGLYLWNRSRLVSLFMFFSLLPSFTMPYFQPWYLPFFFVYPLIPQSKRALQVTLVWLIFMAFVLSFGGLSYNPLAIVDNIRRILQI